MMHHVAKHLRSAAVTALILCVPAVSSAATISISLTDMDVTYLGSQNDGAGAIYDATALAGADGSFVISPTPQADELQAASFELDGANLGTIVDTPGSATDQMWGDLRINGGAGAATLATLNRNTINFTRGSDGGTFGFDWFIKSGTTLGNFLRLGLTNVDVTVTDGTVGSPPKKVFTFTGTATVLSQDLPFGLQFDTSQPVTFTYSAPNPGITGSDPVTTAGVLGASGAMTITGVQIPEPLSVALFGMGGLVLGISRVRNHRTTQAA